MTKYSPMIPKVCELWETLNPKPYVPPIPPGGAAAPVHGVCLALGLMGLIGFIGLIGFVKFMGFIRSIRGFIGFMGFTGLTGLTALVGFIGFIGQRNLESV